MLRRLLLVLLMTCLAVPAMASPLSHDPAVSGHSGHAGNHGADHEGLAPAHLCIGCIAPLHGIAVPDAPAFAPFSPAPAPLSRGADGAWPKPATPPPRA